MKQENYTESAYQQMEEDDENNPYMMYSKLFPNEQKTQDPESKCQYSSFQNDFKEFKFQLAYPELENIIANSVQDKNVNKPFRYLTGNFMKVFERQLDKLEGFQVGIQKRNNIL